MNSNRFYALIVLAGSLLLADTTLALTPFSDNFNSDSLNSKRWGLKNYNKGKLSQGSGRLNFAIGSPPTDDDFSILELRNNKPGFNENWEVSLDVTNTADKGNHFGIGMLIFNAADSKDNLNLEFYGNGQGGGFNVIGITNDKDTPKKDLQKNPGVTSGAMRISFDKTSKLFSLWFDRTGSADGFQWEKICTYSPTGTGGDRRGNWDMNAAGGMFGIKLFGYGEGFSIASGKLRLDNFALKAAK